MKQNLPCTRTFFVAIATPISKIIATAIICLLAFANVNATTNQTINLTAPIKYGGCIDSVFTLIYPSLGSHTIKITANLSGASDNCSSANTYQIFIDSVSVTNATLNYIDNANAAFKCTIIGTDTVKIKWHVRVDCSILSLTNYGQSVNLIQHFKDTSNAFYFKVNGNPADSSSTSVIVPRIESNQTSTPTFYTSYLTERFFEYTFSNYTDADFKMKFKFHVDDTTICSKVTTDSFAYSTSAFGPFIKFTMDNLVILNLPKDSDFFIRQYVTGLSCMPTKCNGFATFKWQCAFSDTVESYFCSSCGKTDTINFEVDSNEICVIKIENMTPNNINNDFSCFNSFQSWSYRMTQHSISTSASDSMFAYIAHYGGGNSINNLTLIPSDLITFNCLHCTATAKIINAPYQEHLCQNYVDSSLTTLEIKVYNFEIGDTLLINFKTFRCAEENDAALLNQPKNLNNWLIGANSYNVCGKLFGSQSSLSSDNFIGYANNIDQQILFFPTFNNIVVPHGQTVSDTNYLSFIMDRLDKRNDYYSNQYLGWSADSAEFPTKAKGILRARITVDEGLHVLPDSLIYFKLDTNGTESRIYPDYYYHTSTNCNPDTLYFYFHLSDTIYYILNFGTFETNVEACCPNDNAPDKHFTVDFHIMPFPNSSCISNSNFYTDTTHTQPPVFSTLARFIPMSGKTHILHIRCPGCLQPGTIIDQFKLKRISWGLTDSNNNGFADFPQTQINTDSAWYIANKNKISELNSSYGDRLGEFTVAHFENGDSTNNGYAYEQMQQTGAILNYLQYSITLQMQNSMDSAISDTLMQQQLGLTPDSLWFFIDVANSGSPYCLDCKPFEADTAYRTILKISVPSTDLNKFLNTDTTNANWFYTFSFVPTDSNSVVGISNPFNKYYDATLFHDSLQAWQRYRIAVFYKECKHFNAPPNPITVEEVMKRREINAMMWLAGANHGSNAFSNTPTAPQNYSELNLHGWKAFSQVNPSLTNMNQQFADSFVFYCEMNGGLHYFFAQNLTFTSTYYKDDYSCGMNMVATATSTVAGGIYDPYPYEYHPPLLYLNQLSFQKPDGFNATIGTATNFFYVPYPNGAFITPFAHYILPSPDTNNFITLNTQSIAPPVCLDESHYNNILSTDSSAYVKDGYTASIWAVNYQPENCFANYVVKADTAIYGLYGNINLPCITSAGCIAGDSVKGYSGQANIASKANIQVTIIPTNNGALTGEMCWHVSLTNPDIIIDSVLIDSVMQFFHTSTAAHIYCVLPLDSFLNNWTFTPDLPLNYTINIPNDSIFHWAAYLAVGGSLSGTFCADYFPCVGEDSVPVTFTLGYDCNHFPAYPFGSDTNCTTYTFTDREMYDVHTSPPTSSSSPVVFSICSAAEKIIDYTTQTNPYLYPDSVVLYNMPPQITIDSAAFSLCNNTATTYPLHSTGIQNHWLIVKDSLDSIGYVDGALSNTYNYDCIRIHLYLHQQCDFYNGIASDSMVLYTHNHCDTVFTKSETPTTFIWNDSSYCTDCFTLTKTVDPSTAYAGDLVTYYIIVCANNVDTQTVSLTDLLPPHFVSISNPFLTDSTPTIVAQGCDTFTITGYFNQIDTCPYTADTALLITADTMLTYSVCNTIICDTCFTITKTADRDTAFIGDTITYYITVHNYNNTPKDVFITDILPPNFDTVSTPFPLYVANFPAGVSVTYTVTGYFTQRDSCPNTMNTVEMIDIASNTYSDSVCIVVTYPCISDSTTIIPDSSLATTVFSTSVSDSNYILEGRLYIDQNMTFTNCVLYALPSAQVLVMQGYSLILDNTDIEGCNSMWQGITVDTSAYIEVVNKSIVRDADVGITMNEGSSFKIEDAHIIDCVRGLYVPSPGCKDMSAVSGSVTGTTFGLTRTTFLPDYTGQPAHGKLPKSGIDVKDFIYQIGDDAKNKNQFNKLNTGLVARMSSIRLFNSTFQNINIDTAYTEAYHGSAIVSVGQDKVCKKYSGITIYPLSDHDTLVQLSFRGVYTNLSSLYITNNKIIRVNTGIRSGSCVNTLSTTIKGCTVYASNRGINFRFNEGAGYMIADSNFINISADTTGIGINMSGATGFANYQITNNTILTASGLNGIHSSAVFKPFIHYNTIYQSSNGTYPKTYGIKIDKGDSAIVSCNYIKCTAHYGNSWGMHINESNYDSILCNTTDTNNIGIFFGGQCASTKLIANTMRANFRGLYLNIYAVIGVQSHFGNRWINYLDTVGAINWDSTTFGLNASLFRVNDTMGTVLFPYLPSWELSWFFPTGGTTLTCGGACTADGSSAGDDVYERSVAQGNSAAAVYPVETKNLAEQYLHETLTADAVLLQSDTVYSNFYDLKEQGNIGKIRKVKDQLKSISYYNDNFKEQMNEADSLIKIHIDSLQILNQLALTNPNVNYNAQFESNRNQINSQDSIKANLIEQQQILETTIIDSATQINNNYTPAALPEENEQFMNTMIILYHRFGQDTLFYYFNSILTIAQQCPYAGGGSVYVARNFIELFNDLIQYDDDGVCLQSGIFKIGHSQNSKQQLIPEIKIVPNPASNTVDIILKNATDGICKIEVTNVLGKIVLDETLSCSDKNKVLNITNLVTGVYIVKVKINDNFVQTNKLIISR